MKRLVIAAFFALGACATPKAAPTNPATPSVSQSDRRDCAVFATILRDQYHVDEKTAYRLQRGNPADPATDYRITCDFAAAGIPVRDYDYAHVNGPGRENFQPWLQLNKPEYPSPDSAVVAAGSLIGPLAGSGLRCFLKKTAGTWALERCEQAWVS